MNRGRNRKRAQHGAIMVEIVVVLVVFLLILVGIMHFRLLMRTRLSVLHGAQRDAWTLATSNDGSCFANQSSYAELIDGHSELDPSASSPVTSEVVNSYQSSASTSLFQYAHADVSWPVGHVVEVRGTLRSLPTVRLRGRAYITCNELVPESPASDQNVVAPLTGFIRSLWSGL